MERTICWFANPMEQEERELARGLRRRDPDLLDRLIEQYHFRLFRYLLMLAGRRQAAEDLFQETWVRVLEKGHQYNPRWKFETWLFSIARNLAIDLLRRRQPESLETLLEAPGATRPRTLEEGHATGAFEDVARGEEAARMAEALQHLPPAYREVLMLRFQEDLELNEIAEVVGAPLSTIKSRLYRGLETLRAVLEGGNA
jgi:RNA polymerase sigma-70 factor (ECF subfamily)